MTPPLAFTQAKYAWAMFAMSVKSVPGCLVLIVPRAIGVPAAFTPGLGPHCDVLTPVEEVEPEVVDPAPDEAVLELAAPAPVLELVLLLPHAARAMSTTKAARDAAKRDRAT